MNGEEGQPVRKSLPHGIPQWLRGNPIWFVTICARERRTRGLVEEAASETILSAVEFHHTLKNWHAYLFLIMPDHVHGLIAFHPERSMEKDIASWKSFTAKRTGIAWQRDFFDHRLRSNESYAEKARYIRENPVRAGLVQTAEQWPHVWTTPNGDMPPYFS